MNFLSIQNKIFMMLSCLFVCVALSTASAQVMQSDEYQIQFDSINAGGLFSTSTNYGLEDTVGEIGTGRSTSTSHILYAGYQQVETQLSASSSISISAESDVTIPAIGGIVGGVGVGSSTWNVITDNTAGYSLTVVASTDPALKSGSYSFADYQSAGPDPDYTWSIAATSSAFGFSPEGVDIVQRFRDNGSLCNAGAGNTTETCWDGFSTTPATVAERHSANYPGGSTTTIRYKAETGSSHIQPAGDYTTIITVTAVTL